MIYLRIEKETVPILGTAKHKNQRGLWGFVIATSQGVKVWIPQLSTTWNFSFKYWVTDPLTREFIKANWK